MSKLAVFTKKKPTVAAVRLIVNKNTNLPLCVITDNYTTNKTQNKEVNKK